MELKNFSFSFAKVIYDPGAVNSLIFFSEIFAQTVAISGIWLICGILKEIII